MVSATPEIAQVAYDHNVLAVAVDWIAIAANDYYASTTGRTAYLAPLETPGVVGINSFVSSQTNRLYVLMHMSNINNRVLCLYNITSNQNIPAI